MAKTVDTKSSEVKTLMNAGSMRVELRVEGKLVVLMPGQRCTVPASMEVPRICGLFVK